MTENFDDLFLEWGKDISQKNMDLLRSGNTFVLLDPYRVPVKIIKVENGLIVEEKIDLDMV